MSVLIKGGRVVTAADSTVADVYIEGERVSLIGTSLDVDADIVIDATGKLVLPGAIDPHTHLDMPFGGTVTIDDFTSGQTAAAFGGTTCHVDFASSRRASRSPSAIDEWHEKARRQGDHRLRLPHRRHRPRGGRHARGARDAPRQGRHLLQDAYGVQGRVPGRRRDAVPGDAGRLADRRARDGPRRERRRDRRARQGGGRRRQPRRRATTR